MTAWFPDWAGQTVAIIASGESTGQIQIERLRGRCRVIVVNNNFMLAPWADMLYAADQKWWKEHREALLFAGLKLTCSADAAKEFGLKLVKLTDRPGDEEKSVLSLGEKGKIGRGGNSAFQAVNIAAQTGAKRQIWIGFDFCGDHWHGKHGAGLKDPRPPTLERWARTLDAQAGVLRAAGIEVVNCSPSSKLTAYRTAALDSVLAEFEWGESVADFAAAEMYLNQAKEAAAAGHSHRSRAACVMVGLALGIGNDRRVDFRTNHLRGAA